MTVSLLITQNQHAAPVISATRIPTLYAYMSLWQPKLGDKNTLDLVPLNADLDFKDLKKTKDNLISVILECCSRTSELLLVMKDFDAISGE